MGDRSAIDSVMARLNPQQRAAATHGDGPLLIVAGAGTGKTATLVHRVAWLIAGGVDPSRILLLTFTRRAAAEMLNRVDDILRQLDKESSKGSPPFSPERKPGYSTRVARVWGGTFHAVATRLLRRYGKAIGLAQEFSVHDRGDSEDLMNVVRTELNLAKTDKRFPKKGTCADIYSRCVNAREKLDVVLKDHFPWCKEWEEQLKQLFNGYVDRKEAANVLDYDDLLLYWHGLLSDPQGGESVRRLFDCVLVDEYQDTNALQAEIIYLLSPDGKGATVVGDDAQSIYSFRAATIKNIFDFPKHYPGTTIVTLEQNYRSTCPILEATNRVIAQSRKRYAKSLWSERSAGERPRFALCEDEEQQADYIIGEILAHRESGVDLRRQAVLFRASHHSMLLEAELTRRNIPFHKFGGLKFVETAHIKDLMAILRLADNPRDLVAGTRVLPLLPGIGPGKARHLMEMLIQSGGNFSAWADWKPPAGAAGVWSELVKLLKELVDTTLDLPAQVNRARKFYTPLLEAKYDHVQARSQDLEQMELIASRYRNRHRMLLEITLDPPSSTQDLAADPLLDDDYLILSTIHSAKGLEWDAVYVIHAADGYIPSDMAVKTPDAIEEERRLFYVALTRAKNHLYVCSPMRFYHSYNAIVNSQYGFAQRTRFLPDSVLESFQQVYSAPGVEEEDVDDEPRFSTRDRHIRRRTKDLWS
jgi:DNA helicase II / ATP-dependent DNA helicase PcrA